ncbi:PLP-dependent aminotransferase family protein [Cohnella sp. WQ 127256]|uniref:aminotransferase-like domain-containing protein n=1 Tax=Cohnella sp. WQ 127256 TaxID=2938790 RepID=UPI0021185AA2
MDWKPQSGSNVSIYKQIYYYYEDQIRNGALVPGAQLPTERQLAQRLSVNRSTVSTAYEELRATGLINSLQGSGTRVSEHMWETSPKVPNWERYTRRTYDPGASLMATILNSFSNPGMINMTKGELSPDLMPMELLRGLSKDMDFKPFSYHTDLRGDWDLRKALSEFLLSTQQIRTEPANVLITSGVKHSLSLIARTLLRPGEAIAVEGPSYLYAMQVFTEAGLRMIKLPVDENGLIPEKLPDLYHKYRVRMVVTNPSFQNPTGTSLTLSRRKKLIEICEQLAIPLVEDDPYGLLQLDDSKEILPSLRSMSGGERFVIYLGTLSKIASPGMRTGWIVAPSSVISRLVEAKYLMGYSTSHLGERLANQLLCSPKLRDHLSGVRHTLRLRRECILVAIKRELEPYADLFARQAPAGGFYVWLKLKRQVPDKVLIEHAIREGVIFYPGSIYGEGSGYIRLTYASIAEKDIEEGVRRIRNVLKQLLGISDL